MMGSGVYGGLFVWLILLILIAVIIYMFASRHNKWGSPIESAKESPTEILKRRYAKGEITKEEFDRLKREIES